MRAIMVMYDSLNRNFLPNYGSGEHRLPNFERLGRECVTFDNNYAGSLPCMPARRELHTGRYNFLHREWGPLEPYDDSMPELLKQAGIYTHLISDHCHYWEDGGATYHGRYSSWQNVRGQEGDAWIPRPGAEDHDQYLHPAVPGTPPAKKRLQNSINSAYIRQRGEFPQEETFRYGLDFLEHNHGQDNWFLQIETFDPHEPFLVPDRLDREFSEPNDKPYNWPSYGPAFDSEELVRGIRNKYLGLLALCDECLGRVLDLMDRYDMWKDTMLIVNTDHGFLLGERQWWGKNIMPLYNELVRTPLFVWDPRSGKKDARREALVQTIDLAPTLLDFFGVDIPKDMQGKPLKETIAFDRPVREYALFGNFGAHINITDGQWVYMRAPKDCENAPLNCYTQVPMNLRGRMEPALLAKAALEPPMSFTKGTPLMKFPVRDYFNTVSPKYRFGNKLYHLAEDQKTQIYTENDTEELRLLSAMRRLMLESDAPKEQFERVGISADHDMTAEELSAEKTARAQKLVPAGCEELVWNENAFWKYEAMGRILPEKDAGRLADCLNETAKRAGTRDVTDDVLKAVMAQMFSREEYPAAWVQVMKDGKIE